MFYVNFAYLIYEFSYFKNKMHTMNKVVYDKTLA